MLRQSRSETGGLAGGSVGGSTGGSEPREGRAALLSRTLTEVLELRAELELPAAGGSARREDVSLADDGVACAVADEELAGYYWSEDDDYYWSGDDDDDDDGYDDGYGGYDTHAAETETDFYGVAEHPKVAGRAQKEWESRYGWDRSYSKAAMQRLEHHEHRHVYGVIGEPGTAKHRSTADRLQKLAQAYATASPRAREKMLALVTVAERGFFGDRLLKIGGSALQQSFLEKHLGAVQSALGETGIKPTYVRPLHLGAEPLQAFTKWAAAVGVQPRVAWHGTSAGHHDSIARHGLLVPGGDGVSSRWAGKPNVGVVHGQAHGKGIYTSTTPGTASAYARDGSMLLTAVLDTPDDTHHPAHGLTDIMVVKREDNVLPMYEVGFERTGSGCGARGGLAGGSVVRYADELNPNPNINRHRFGGSQIAQLALDDPYVPSKDPHLYRQRDRARQARRGKLAGRSRRPTPRPSWWLRSVRRPKRSGRPSGSSGERGRRRRKWRRRKRRRGRRRGRRLAAGCRPRQRCGGSARRRRCSASGVGPRGGSPRRSVARHTHGSGCCKR